MENEKMTIRDISSVKKSQNGVTIEITSKEETHLKAVREMVESCAAGACDCMKPEVKKKVTGMEFKTTDGKSAIHISGDISIEEIHETMDRSEKEIDSSCCSLGGSETSKCCG